MPWVAPALEPEPSPERWWVAVSISIGVLMGSIDSSIVNVALPQMRGTLGATLQEITWVATGYVIASVIVMPLTGFLGALLGQKRLYLSFFSLFLVGSLLCGMARTLPLLVVFRVLQGIGGGALQPTAQAVLRQAFPPREHGMAIAAFAMTVMVGSALGPTLGGYIVDHDSWEWIFLINLPVGAVGFLMVTRFFHEPEDIRAANRVRAEHQKKNLDWQGITLLSVGLALLQYVLEEGEQDGWFDSRVIALCAFGSALALVLLLYRELTAKAPVMNLRLFKDAVFSSGTLIGGLTFAMLTANMFLLPVFMQEVLGFTALQAGTALLYRVAIMMVLSPIVGRLYGRVSVRAMAGVGTLLFFAGCWMMKDFTLLTSSFDVGVSLLFQGAGFALLYVPMTTVALVQIPRAKLADATGLFALVRQIFASVALAVFGTLITRFGVEDRASIASHLTITSPQVQDRLELLRRMLVARGYGPGDAEHGALALVMAAVRQQASVITFERLFLLAGFALLFSLPLIFLLREPKGGGGQVVVEVE